MSTKHKGVNLISRVSVLVALAASVCVAFSGCGKSKDTAQDRRAKASSQIKLFNQALGNYMLDVGTYPSSLEGLVTNVDKSEKWDGPYLKPPKVPKDPWGNEYQYRFPGESPETKYGGYDLCSYGADGKEDGFGENADTCNTLVWLRPEILEGGEGENADSDQSIRGN